VATVASLPEIEAETIEFRVNENSKITKKPLKDIKFPKSAIVGAILREDEYLTPMGNTQIQAGDDVIVFMLPHTRDQVEKLFR
jgi:trk system potassium uptake protein TrkA